MKIKTVKFALMGNRLVTAIELAGLTVDVTTERDGNGNVDRCASWIFCRHHQPDTLTDTQAVAVASELLRDVQTLLDTRHPDALFTAGCARVTVELDGKTKPAGQKVETKMASKEDAENVAHHLVELARCSLNLSCEYRERVNL